MDVRAAKRWQINIVFLYLVGKLTFHQIISFVVEERFFSVNFGFWISTISGEKLFLILYFNVFKVLNYRKETI